MNVEFAHTNVENAWAYFPKRNGINVRNKIQFDKNYDSETLKYMSKPWVARVTADYMEEFLGNRRYFIIEICAGTGGNTLEFLDRKNLSAILAYEKNEKRNLMLQRNILMYNFGNRAMVNAKETTGNENFSEYSDSVFFFDPPWLPSDLVKAGEDYRKYYITKNMKVGELFLEQWLEKLKTTAYMVVFRLPPESELSEVPGWTYVMYDIEKPDKKSTNYVEFPGKNGRLFICINNRKIRSASETEFGGLVKKEEVIPKMEPISPFLANLFDKYITKCEKQKMDVAKRDETCKLFVKYSFREPGPLAPTEPEALPAPISPKAEILDSNINPNDLGTSWYTPENIHMYKDIPKPSKGLNVDSPEWLAEFLEYIRWVLKKFISKDEIVNDLLTTDYNVKTWIQAFTHESFNPDLTSNYQSLETLGDNTGGSSFIIYTYDHYKGNINPKDLTNLKKAVMSKQFQGFVSKYTFGFRNWLLSQAKKDLNVDEDLFESFTGALHQTGDNTKYGLGMVLCRKFMKYIMSKIDIAKIEIDESEPDQTLRQSFEQIKFSKDNIIENIKPVGEFYVASLTLSPALTTFLLENKINVPKSGPLTVNKNKTNKKAAEKAVYFDALKMLRNLGFTKQFVEKVREKRNIDALNELNEKLVKIFLGKIQRDNLDYEFEENVASKITQLVGIDKDGKRDILASVKNTSTDSRVNKLAAIQEYVDAL